MAEASSRYSGMRDTGVEWVGRLPLHWKVLPNRALFMEIVERGYPDEEMLSVTISSGVLRQRDLLAASSKKDASNDDKSKYKLVCPGDIVYNKMRAWQGALGISPYRGIVSPAYIVVRPREPQVGEYFHYLFRTRAFAREAQRWSYGISSDQWSLRPQQFKQIYCPTPPPDEQQLIAQFLRTSERPILQSIAAQRKLIVLLQQQKDEIVQKALTRGIRSAVALKDSGVNWLGDVPEHWTLKRFKFIAQITKGQVDPTESAYKNYILIAPNHIEKGTGKLLFQQTAADQGADSGKYLCNKGQIIYSKIRPNLRKATIAPIGCLCSADMYPITVDETELVTEYCLALMLSGPFTRYAVDWSLRVAMPKVNREALGACWFWYPPKDEQLQILNFLREAVAPIDRAINNAQRSIELLREYHIRLVTDVVMGVRDIRELRALDANGSDPGQELEARDIVEPSELDDIALAETLA